MPFFFLVSPSSKCLPKIGHQKLTQLLMCPFHDDDAPALQPRRSDFRLRRPAHRSWRRPSLRPPRRRGRWRQCEGLSLTRTRRTRGVGGLAQQATAIHDPSVPPGSENHVKYQEANGEASRAACPNQHATCCLAAGCLYSKREVKTSKMPLRYRLNIGIYVWN